MQCQLTMDSLNFHVYTVKIFCLHPDINECNSTNGGCEQICTNAVGNFSCNCTVGYQLDANGFNCTGMLALSRCCFPAYMFYSCMQTLMNVREMRTTVM